MKNLPIFAVALSTLTLVACSTFRYYESHVVIDEEISMPEGASLMMVHIDVDYADPDSPSSAYGDSVPMDPETREYEALIKTCCSPIQELFIYAYIDLDGDEIWDEGEPWGADPNNPVTLEDDDYLSEIVVLQDESAP